MECCAVTILRVGRPRLRERADRAGAVAQFLAQLAQHEPGRRITRRQLQGLHQQIGGAGKVAFGLAIARPFKATVGDQIAGRQMDRLQLQGVKFPILGMS